MSQLKRFLKKVFIRVLAFSAGTQALAWLMGVDEQVRLWLVEHRLWVVAGIIIYVLWDYMWYGGKEAAYYEELKKRRPRKLK